MGFLGKEFVLDRHLRPGVRVTVKLREDDSNGIDSVIDCKAVPPTEPRTRYKCLIYISMFVFRGVFLSLLIIYHSSV